MRWGHVVGEFALQMVVGTTVGVLGGIALLWFMRNVPLPSEALYPLRALATAFVVFGLASVAHGSGFLAIFVAGIVIGDERAPYKREVERFASVMASLAEIVAFVALGLTVDLDEITHTDVWVVGLVIGLALIVVIRPLLVGAVMLPFEFARNERAFVLFCGLKGAVPLLLGTLILSETVPDGDRVYGIVIVVVMVLGPRPGHLGAYRRATAEHPHAEARPRALGAGRAPSGRARRRPPSGGRGGLAR